MNCSNGGPHKFTRPPWLTRINGIAIYKNICVTCGYMEDVKT